ncbi:hypothetical protein ABL78_7568 [Leptomonas seymouri]|uniref:Uncharacterized protein n=1 Tax=Leptomonas seymouri TaxID=5684 RepID=A0A0N1I1S5_LEPSE|nr:hypothetical protein ABL78_7568 [Leptomonas seymouri]|eukprot:KPI83401.1 hypothetical protein ABL78_7568 [Leptomonas seymouri]
MRPSFRLGGSVAAPHPLPDSDSDPCVVCELSPVQPLRPSHGNSPPVEERLLHYGRLYDEKRRLSQAIRRREEAAALAEATRQPSPLPSRRLFAPTPSVHALAEVSRRHRADRLSAYLSEREADQTRRPSILPASRDMAAVLRQREKWEGLSVGEILHARQRIHEERMEQKRREVAANLPFKPAVSVHTKRLKVSGPVVERLYAPRPATATTSSSKKEKNGSALTDVTNRDHSQTSVKPTPASAATYRRLYDDAVSRRTRNVAQNDSERDHSSARRPHIDPVSALIASQSGDTAIARLLRPKALPDPTRHVNPEETFAPRIGRTTTPQPSRSSLPLRSGMWLRRRRDRLRHVAEERHEAEMRECTFHPCTNRGPVTSSPWGTSDDADTPLSSSADLIESAEELLSHIHLEEAPLCGGHPQQGTSQHWAGVLSSTLPCGLLDLLEAVEPTSIDVHRPSFP